MKTILALLSAACLCAQGVAQAQSTAPAAPKVPAPATAGSRLKAVPAKPGSGQTASLSESEGSNCPVDGNGDSQCVVTSSGTRSGGGGGSYTPPEPGREPGEGGRGGSGADSGGPSEASLTKEAAEIARGLELPCPEVDESRLTYLDRMADFCVSKVKAAYPYWSKLWPPLPYSACTLAGIKQRAGLVYIGELACKKEE